MNRTMEAERTDLMLAFGDAFNRRDIDSVMSMMTDDCVFVDADGSKHVRPEQVRARFVSNWDRKARFHFGNVRHFVSGDRGYLGWTLTRETLGGERCEAEGCDILTFRDGEIAVKDGYRKGTGATKHSVSWGGSPYIIGKGRSFPTRLDGGSNG